MLDLISIKEALSHHGYEYEGFIGRGGFSNVFLCKSTKYNQTFAVKKGEKDHMTKVEFDHLISLDHSNIIKLYDVFNDHESQYLVMEYCPNGTILNKGCLSYDKFVYYAKQILEALAFCHANNIVHGDIKPDNILLDQYDRIKLADFGLARQFDINEKSSDKCGPMMLFPPEMFNMDEIDPFKADIYELGVTFYYMATGSYPYQRIKANDLKNAFLKTDIFSTKNKIHPKIKELIDKMAERNAKELLTAEKLLKLPIFLPKIVNKQLNFYNTAGYRTKSNMCLESMRIDLNQPQAQSTDVLTYRSININPKILKMNRIFQPKRTF
ncbi:hypothetical protein M9Y10_023899 [Tritrichomonas musculus]|uniref:Protein kinase domain-containing protein n=1 Tax=Tritrichomonas musculus TaxID=1915356 RepID=A0ABR2KWE8_9EUKA